MTDSTATMNLHGFPPWREGGQGPMFAEQSSPGRYSISSLHAPTTAYVDRLMSAAADGDQQRMEQLCDEEVAATLRDTRHQTKAG